MAHSEKTQTGLANATIQQRLTAVRLFYDHLVFEAVRNQNPVGRGVYTPSRAFGVANGQREHRVRGLVRRFEPLPWIPSDDEWRAVLAAIQTESLRNRTMFALSYDSALRREELCGLQIRDLDVANRMLTIRAETTKGRRTRVVPYGPHSCTLYTAYLHQRREVVWAKDLVRSFVFGMVFGVTSLREATTAIQQVLES